MKRTLIFLSVFFLSLAAFAEIQKKYHVDKKTGVVTLELVEVQVIERLSFTNNTPYTFSKETLDILFQGGETVGVASQVESIFPPTSLKTKEFISISDGQTIVRQGPATPQRDLWILWLALILPLTTILLLGVTTPRNKGRGLVLLFIIVGTTAVLGGAAPLILGDIQQAAAVYLVCIGILLVLAVRIAYRTLQVSSVVTVLTCLLLVFVFCWASLFSHKNTLVLQYILFIVVSCAVSFMVRLLYFKRKKPLEEKSWRRGLQE